MRLLKLLNEINLPKKKWTEVELNSLTSDQLKGLWDMYKNTYAYIDLSFNDVMEMKSLYKVSMLIDIDNDILPNAFILYKKKFGNKISFLGTDGSKEAKRELVKKFKELINTSGWWIEASAKMEELAKNIGAPIVNNKEFVEKALKGKEVEWIGDGYYKRKLKKVSKKIVKRIYGKPKI